jgi:hypothetical protein
MDILERMKEPSSWAGVASMIAMVWASMPEGFGKYLAMAGAGISGLISVIMAEKK